MIRIRLALLALPLTLTACKGEEPTKAAHASQSPSTFAVDPILIVEKPLDVQVNLPGELTPFDAVEIYPRESGFVKKLPVDRGTVVKRGELLAELEAPELTSQRAEAEAKLAGDESTLERLQAAQAQTPGSIAEHEIELASAALRASTAKVQSLRTLESYLVVTAPFDGIVTERAVSVGALVGPPAGGKGTLMLKMETVAKLRLVVAVPEDQTSSIKPGDSAEFTVPAWPGRKFPARISRVAHAVDQQTRTMPVELDVDNPDNAVSSGMYATVSWHVRRPGPSLFVPDSAIVQGTDRTFVVRVSGGKADPVSVKRGVAMNGLIEVFGALHAGDAIAKRGSEELKSGTAVAFRQPPQPAAFESASSSTSAPASSGAK